MQDDHSGTTRHYHFLVVNRSLTTDRILDNAHLLDATEIFRKLNVHKKVISELRLECNMNLTYFIGIIRQTWFPPRHVLLLPLLHDRSLDPRRVKLDSTILT